MTSPDSSPAPAPDAPAETAAQDVPAAPAPTTPIEARDVLIAQLRAEVTGPAPAGLPLDIASPGLRETAQLYQPWRQAATGEEILTSGPPLQRYGAGVLHAQPVSGPGAAAALPAGGPDDGPPVDVPDEPDPDGDSAVEGEGVVDGADHPDTSSGAGAGVDDADAGEAGGYNRADDEDFELTSSNGYTPSSMAVSLLARHVDGATVTVTFTGGRYRSKEARAGDRTATWWLRSPVRALWTCPLGTRSPTLVESQDLELLRPVLTVVARRHRNAGGSAAWLLTVAVTNRSDGASGLSPNALALFQSHLEVTVTAPDGSSLLLPYPAGRTARAGTGGPAAEEVADEEASLRLLYRRRPVWAVGHGCAAEWALSDPAQSDSVALHVAGCALPTVELPEMTPDVTLPDGAALRVSMRDLAGVSRPPADLVDVLRPVVEAYEAWIRDTDAQAGVLPPEHRSAGARHLAALRRCAARMRGGLDLLARDEDAARAFRLANEAVLLQQLRGRQTLRAVTIDAATKLLTVAPLTVDTDPAGTSGGAANVGYWRAFQIGFLLSAVASMADGAHEDREVVDLIWFPTGGGKTEAYLGLTAFAVLLRSIRDVADTGVNVLMRYTLRLLTAQQFERAARLMCALEVIRRREWPRLAADRASMYRTGIWVGSASTPNSDRSAVDSLGELQKVAEAPNPFLLRQCPWCQTQMGPLESGGPSRKRQQAVHVVGFERKGNSVEFRCPDAACAFHAYVPVEVIDEAIYRTRPTLVIGTVDKFAMLAWRPEARSLFGLNAAGERVTGPPGLILQDELHLISGPLGSVTGLYETLIEELCTDRRGGRVVRPKIVASTATIRSSAPQVRSLYARARTDLFPPPGLDSDDSFFARVARGPDGRPCRGKIYAGIHAPGYASVQTAQVRTFGSLLHAVQVLPDAQKDPWWTLLVFYNSLREIGGAQSLFQSDIPEILGALRKRGGHASRRYLNRGLELTGRISAEEVPASLDKLSRRHSGAPGPSPALDYCLASNIIEVGVDIDRLSLMGIVGQPKTTAQYIQVSGRVGRRWQERPGLVVTIYNPSRPRDRSHFEHFRAYHQQLYAQVEPTSVTPFSVSALTRALPGLMVAWVRQFGPQTVLPSSEGGVVERLLERLHESLLRRIGLADSAEVARFEAQWTRRHAEWMAGGATTWLSVGQRFPDEETLLSSLMYRAGDEVSETVARRRWPVAMSMRTVDREVTVRILPPLLGATGAAVPAAPAAPPPPALPAAP